LQRADSGPIAGRSCTQISPPPSSNVIQQFNAVQSLLNVTACQLHHKVYRLTLNTVHSTLFTLNCVHCVSSRTYT